jgi:hypothetical protein
MGPRPTQGDEDRLWRELQLAASASAGGRAANFGMFFNGAVLACPLLYSRGSVRSLGVTTPAPSARQSNLSQFAIGLSLTALRRTGEVFFEESQQSPPLRLA